MFQSKVDINIIFYFFYKKNYINHGSGKNLQLLSKGTSVSIKSGYRQFALPTDLIEDIESFTNNHRNLGYKSTPEFIREAIRFYLRELKNQEKY